MVAEVLCEDSSVSQKDVFEDLGAGEDRNGSAVGEVPESGNILFIHSDLLISYVNSPDRGCLNSRDLNSRDWDSVYSPWVTVHHRL